MAACAPRARLRHCPEADDAWPPGGVIGSCPFSGPARTAVDRNGSVAGDAVVHHLAADARCRPLAFVLTAGQADDAPAFTEVMARLRLPRRRGRPRTRPDLVLADKASTYRQRNTVERCINRLKQWRGIAARYESSGSFSRGSGR
ncbi:hypothetical protein GCM10009680_57240 [Streptomyces yatensis]|uniref:Transposase n=1 Tax=Streptomyces yatensis TaxID=155177 RepID=A0ABN2IP05_9ACTN